MLSADVAEQLRTALAARWERPMDSDALLRAALGEAARDAKQRLLRPEELLLALKAIEDQVAASIDRIDAEEREQLRHWLVGACMRAFFNDPQADA